MTLSVQMQGQLNPILVEDDYAEAVTKINMAAAQGMKFIMVDLRDGSNAALAIQNINSIVEEDEF